MSQENVEVVKAAFEAWNAGDMDALRDLCDPDVIVRPMLSTEDGLQGGAKRGSGVGHARVRANARDLGRPTERNQSPTSSTLATESLRGSSGVAQATDRLLDSK